MKIGINIDFFTKNTTMAKACGFAAEAGFKFLDYTPPVHLDNWESVMKEHLEIFRANGLSVHQTHVPFNRYGQYGGKHRLCVDRCMEATAFMGAKFTAVHGDEFDFENMTYSDEAVFNYNHDYYEPYIKIAKEAGFKLAFETVFEEHPTNRRYTSAPEELLKLINSFESENVVCCWDFGHANVAFGEAAPDRIVEFGSLIQCTHLHDNTGMDSHQLPMSGDINWNKTMEAFRKIGYNGVMSVEYAHGDMPEHVISDFLKLTHKITKHLIDM